MLVMVVVKGGSWRDRRDTQLKLLLLQLQLQLL